MEQTFAILKNRWREVCFLFALWIVSSLLECASRMSFKSGSHPSNTTMLFDAANFCVLFLELVLSAGFVRLACLRGREHQSLPPLWRAGICFFWRMLGFDCLIGIIALVISVLIRKTLFALVSPGIPASPTAKLCMLHLSFIILMKPLIYVPAIIISQNAGNWAAWKRMRSFRILAAPQLPVLFLLYEFLYLGICLVPQTPVWNSSSTILVSIVSNFIWFLILLDAARIAGRVPDTAESSSAIVA